MLDTTLQLRTDDLVRDYTRSEITAIWIHHRPTEGSDGWHQLLFAVAEMGPVEQPRSPEINTVADDGKVYPMKRKSLDNARTLYATRVFTDDPMDAVRFYRGDAAGRRTLSLPTGDVTFESVAPLVAEPPNEVPAIVPTNLFAESSFGAVLPRRATSLRVWSWLDPQGVVRQQFEDGEWDGVREFAINALGVDLAQFPEHVGAVHLCAENPLLRFIRHRLAGDESALLVEFYERAGRTVKGCTVRLTDERAHGIGFVTDHTVHASRLVVPIPYSPETLRFQLFAPNGALLHDSTGNFIHHVGIDLGIVTTRRLVTIRDPNTGAEETQEVDVAERQEIRIPSGERDVTASMAIRDGEETRALAQLEKTKKFVYYPGGPRSRGKALRHLRELLASARDRCLIFDPYLGARDVVQYIPFISSKGLTVRLLSSAAFLRERSVSGNARSARQGELMQGAIEELRNQDPGLDVQCRVLPGAKSPIHDRFLVIDDDVYILGSSFNEFGSRVTILFRSPDPRDTIADLENRWGDEKLSRSLDDWIGTNRASGDGGSLGPADGGATDATGLAPGH